MPNDRETVKYPPSQIGHQFEILTKGSVAGHLRVAISQNIRDVPKR